MKNSSKRKNWGFDLKDIDRSVRPQDDFYHYANGGWHKRTKIPAEESRWGSFLILRHTTEKQLQTLVNSLLKKNTRYPGGSDAQLVADSYRSAANFSLRNKLGTEPIEPFLRKVRAIGSTKEMLQVISEFHARGMSSLWGVFVDQDSKNSSRYALHLWQGGLSLPDRDYYLLDKPEQKRIREAYVKHIERLLRLAQYPTDESVRIKKAVLKIETALARAAMSKEDIREPEKTYHKMSLQKLERLFPAPWKKYFSELGYVPSTVIVGQPLFFKSLAKALRSFPLEDWKRYMEWHLLNGTASALSEKFVRANFEFYGKTLTGQKTLRSPWRRALSSTTSRVGESLGKLYIKKHFPESSKEVMDVLVQDLFEVFAERIKELDWMSPATKKKALKKLSAISRKIGYPEKWRGYKGLKIKPDDLFGNILRSAQYEMRRQMKKLRGPVDRSEWFMYPQAVNAYFAPNLNEIVFPAGILQPPFFDLSADMAVNYAGIGSVIGHEITHGFDDMGSKFDAKGTMKNWWTALDRRRFERKTKVFVEQANRFEVQPGVYLNGKLTLGENMADMGGLIIGFEAYQKFLNKHGRKIIDGLSPEQRFFLGYAQMEREIARPEIRKLTALTDPHADNVWRINGPLSNFEPFYQTFGVKKGHRLYRNPKARARVW